MVDGIRSINQQLNIREHTPEEELMPFMVNVREDLSMADLVRIHGSGGSVIKTPHVGNIYPGNLAVGKLGLRMVFYDRTIGNRDSNFHPHGVILGGRFERLADETLLTTHTRVLGSSSMAPEWFEAGGSMLDGHMRALRAALPNIHAKAYTEWLAEKADDVIDLLRAMTKANPRIWDRSVLSDGSVQGFQCDNWDALTQRGLYGLCDANQGVLVPNVANVLLLSILEVRERGLSEVYHLSGPDMVVYIRHMLKDLHHLYDAIRHKLPGWRLPETLTFHLVPVADLRWGVPMGRRAELDELVDSFLSAAHNGKSYGARVKAAINGARKKVIAEVAEAREADNLRVQEALRGCPDPFYRIEAANCVSQYDLLQRGEDFYVHPWAIETPIGVIKQTVKRMVKMRRRL
ncbi:MAG: hypothetical protein P8J32_00350 [bacterium]|nr:hypothetical protein [bacterium]